MCGRFTNQFTWRELVELYRITEPYLTPLSNLQPRFNFAPTDTGPVLRLDREGRREPVMMRVAHRKDFVSVGGHKALPAIVAALIGRLRIGCQPEP